MILSVLKQVRKLETKLRVKGFLISLFFVGESGETTSEENLITHYRKEQQQHKNNQQILRHIDNSMARSDSMYTTWSKLKQRSSEHLQLRRHPSGNNNTTQTDTTQDSNNINNSNTVKSLSLPNLFRQKQR